MNITVKNINDIVAVGLPVQIDGKNADSISTEILALITGKTKFLMDLTQVSYVSSAGLRMLMNVYRQSLAQDAKLALVGVSEDLKDTMLITGFLDFFKIVESLDEGVKFLNQ